MQREKERKNFLKPFIKTQGALSKEKSRKKTVKIKMEDRN